MNLRNRVQNNTDSHGYAIAGRVIMLARSRNDPREDGDQGQYPFDLDVPARQKVRQIRELLHSLKV